MTVSSAKTGAVGLSFALDNNYMEPIATTLVGSGGTNVVTFNDIPQTYKHLQIRALTRASGAGANNQIQFNSDVGANYSFHALYGDGATPTSGAVINSSFAYAGYTSYSSIGSNIFSAVVLDILDYANTNKFKTIRSLNGFDANGSGLIHFASGSWRNTDSITSIRFTMNVGDFTQYSRFSLYGIKG
jgi:hypothetical protein